MYRTGDGRFVVSAQHLLGFLACGHLTTLSTAAAVGQLVKPDREDPELDVVLERGLEHEAAHLDHLKQQGLRIVEIADDLRSDRDLLEAMDATIAAMREGVDVVFQAAFLDEGTNVSWRGHADFLTRVDTPSDLGPFSYEPEDTKLARQVKPSAVLQLCHYAEHLERLQRWAPEQLHVVLGNHERVSLRYRDFAAYYRMAKQRFLEYVQVALSATQPATYPDPVAHCALCSWMEHCDTQRAADDHLTLVATLTSEQARKLGGYGITTVAQLASFDEDLPGIRIGGSTLERLRDQARLQVAQRENPDEPPPYELLEPHAERGLGALPEPSDGDLFFDIEGDPYVGTDGLEYLLGVGWFEGGAFQYRSFWAHDAAEEKASFEAFIDFVVERLERYPDLHIYHYADYERTALGKLMGRYATREDEVDRLFRGNVLVDLYRVVRQGVRVGTPSYSLKKLEPLYMEARTADITDAGSSIVEYERWLRTGEQTILEELEQYNCDDCESTLHLRNWLEERRAEAATKWGAELARPLLSEKDAQDDLAEEIAAVQELVDGLTDGQDVLPSEGDAEARARWLLAQLLGWHRREAKPEWWRYFQRIHDSTPDDLYADSEAIAGLEYVGEVGQVKQSTIHRYRFDADQEHKLFVDSRVEDPDHMREKMAELTAREGPGSLHAIDASVGTLDLKRAKNSTATHPRALIPSGPVGTKPLWESLQRLARHTIDHGIASPGSGKAVRELLLQRPPAIAGNASEGELRRPGEDALDAAQRLAEGLDHSYLAIQGPPGSGKTYTAAQIILTLVEDGYRVGVTAHSHKVIGNALERLVACGEDAGAAPRIIQRADSGKGVDHEAVRLGSNEDVAGALGSNDVDVVAGTTWLFSREELVDKLDYLLVDEAGQMSLANLCAAGMSAQNLILVGDPQQLAQPSKGTHPPGVGISALDHLLDGHSVISEHMGLFLEHTRRLHPKIAEFVSELAYDERLETLPECADQSVDEGPAVAGSGIRWVPVEHAGNRTSSVEEAEAVAEVYRSLLGRTWRTSPGVATLTADDILVIAPYNAQVRLLSEELGSDAHIGTVDKFQGQEAPVVLGSLAASSAEDVPRGMKFLYSRNRLNVAVSRAKALTVMFFSPRLLEANCRTVEQLHLANGLCRYAELAERVEIPSRYPSTVLPT